MNGRKLLYHYRMIRLLPLIAALLLALPALAQDNDARLRQSSEELKRVQGKIEALNQKIENERGRQDSLRQELESTEKQIQDTKGRLREIAGLLGEQQRKIRATRDEQARVERSLNDAKHALAQQIRAAYMIGERGQIRLLLNQDNAQKMDRVSTYYDYLNRARTDYVVRIHDQFDKLSTLQDRLSQQNADLLRLKDRQQKTLAALETTRSARGETIRAINERISNELDEIKQLRANEQQIQSLLKSLREALANLSTDFGDARPFPKMKGRLPWPIRGKLLASFGEAKAGGRLSWNGLWIDAPEGAPVRAVAGGRVAYVGWLQRYGLIIILEHEGGYFSLYGHNDSVDRQVGEQVHPGDTIARVGSTGGYEQPGLYFEIRQGTEPINPKLWLGK
ncbi:MAG: hypothetical protein E6R07_06515 [Nevskiaceae bacterium]|nr:MAG: hypothetical protein E6R07_06515 [Nevskiaceae bacterium]